MWRRIADWCVPAGTFPRHLTLGDDWRTLADWAHIHYAYDAGVWVRRPDPLAPGEYERIKARWLEAHGRGTPTPL